MISQFENSSGIHQGGGDVPRMIEKISLTLNNNQRNSIQEDHEIAAPESTTMDDQEIKYLNPRGRRIQTAVCRANKVV